MKIAVNLLPLLNNIAGAERYARDTIKYLARIDKNNEYYLVVTNINKGIYKIDQPNFKQIILSLKTNIRPLRILAEQFLLPLILKMHKIDLLFSPCNISPVFIPCKAVTTIFDLHWFVYPEMFSPIRNFYIRTMFQRSASVADKIITISENSKNDIVNYLKIQPEKIVVILGGSDPSEDFSSKLASKTKIDQLRSRLKLGAGPFILNVSQTHKRKNGLGLLQAYLTLRQNHSIKHKLVFAGRPGDNHKALEDFIAVHNLHEWVILTGYLDLSELKILYQQADVFVYPSFYEGFGYPPLEALAFDVPVIISNISSLPEGVGEAGIKINPNNISEIAEAIYRLINNSQLRQEMKEKGRIRLQNFKWEKIAQKTLRTFNEV